MVTKVIKGRKGQSLVGSVRTVISLLICCFLFAITPAAAYGEQAADVSTGDYIYCGSFNDSPIKWKVLDAQSMNTGDPGAYLFSEYVLDRAGTAFDEYIVGWQGSLAQEWCGNFFDSSFSPLEKTAIPAVSKTEEPCQYFGLRWGATELIDENVFFISSLELTQYIGDHDGAEGLSGYTSDGTPGYYWLRTSHQNHTDYSGLVIQDNDVHDFLVYIVWGCRPAMNLDYSKVVNILPAYEGASGEWKLTVADDSRDFQVSNVRVDGSTLSVDYAIADYSDGQFISMLVKDADGTTVHSERLCPAEAAAGAAQIDMSQFTIPEGGHFFLFAETDNGDYMTGIASKVQELSCKVSFDAGEGSGAMDAASAAPGTGYQLPACGFTPPDCQEFDHWEKDGEAVDGSFTVNEDTTLRAVYKDIKVSAISFDRKIADIELLQDASCTAIIAPDNAADKTVAWDCSDTRVVAFSDNQDGSCQIKGRWPGTAVITASSADGGASGSFSVTVTGSTALAITITYWPYAAAAAVALVVMLMILHKINKKPKKKPEEAEQ